VVHRRDKLRASAIMQEKAFKNEKIDFLWNKQIIEILGEPETGVEGIRMKDTVTGEESTLACEGVFMAIGHVPNTQVFKGQLETDNVGYLITKPKSMATSVEGVFAAGDVQDSVYRQAISAAGSGCMAALDAQHYLEELEYKNQQ
ncbi:MAG TPA: thioredoxin-disulfide reductase, partial [Caldithrix sp.]|nr:thioredoxin-disulfide reductase [Caldithrix sp.]